MSDVRDAILESRERAATSYEDRRPVRRCEMVGVDSTTDPAVSGKSGFVWVQPDGRVPFQVLNPYVQRRVGLVVLVGPDPQIQHRQVVLGVDHATMVIDGTYDGTPYLGNHAASHEWPDFAPGGDVVSVYPRAFTQLRTYAGSGVAVSIQPYRYNLNGTVTEYAGETDVSISSSIPSAGAYPASAVWRFTLIYLDTATNAIAAAYGTAVVLSSTPTKPDCPAGGIPSAYIALNDTTASITESLIYDARMPFEIVDAGMFGAVETALWLDHFMDIEMTAFQIREQNKARSVLAAEHIRDVMWTRHLAGPS